jgi:16S rRNA (guanine527-N7)-methyltransferase
VNQERLATSIAAGAQKLQQDLSDCAIEKLTVLLIELRRWGERVNLTAIRDLNAMVSGHVLDSLSVRPLLEGSRIIDIGTGAGFPGLPLAIVAPRQQFVLLDSNGKKIGFVRHMIADLQLDNALAVQARAEDYAPGERFDTVIARALAAAPRLIALAGHLVERNGVLLAQKGQYPAAELEQLPENWEYRVTELNVPGLEQHARHVVCLRRAETT